MGARSPSPRAQPRSPDSGGGGSERPGPSLEGAARQWAAGAASAASVAARSARPSPARIWSPRAPRCLPLLLCHRPAGGSPGPHARSILFSLVYGFPRAKNFASVPASVSRPLPLSPRDSPFPWARARTLAHTHTLTLAGARAHGRAP